MGNWMNLNMLVGVGCRGGMLGRTPKELRFLKTFADLALAWYRWCRPRFHPR